MDDLERQLHNYWSGITDAHPLPDVGPMLGVLQLEPDAPTSDDYWVETITLEAPPEEPARPRWYVGVAAVALLVVAFSGMYVLSRTIGVNPGAEVNAPNIVPQNFFDARVLFTESSPTEIRLAAGNSIQKPNIVHATPGDDGLGPLPLGDVSDLPDGPYLDFLRGSCRNDPCAHEEDDEHDYEDDFAHFYQAEDPERDVGPIAPGSPFYIRQGFVNETGEPLGAGFDVALYVIEPEVENEFGGITSGSTTRYTSDYVIRGETDRCGPRSENQQGPVTCEWFVHEFPDGLPLGGYEMWAVWEAPCSAWVGLGYTDFCVEPNEVMSFLSSGVDTSFGDAIESFPDEGDYMVDASGSAPTYSVPLSDLSGALPGDDGSDPLPLGTVTELPDGEYLDFLFEHCFYDCFRDAHFVSDDDPTRGVSVFPSGRPFVVREGFVNDTAMPLGEGFDVVLYVFGISPDDQYLIGPIRKYTSDYVIRGETDRCGPGYNDQEGPVTCEWFVHEFPDGVPEGRFALWAFWEAPCSAWVDLGFTEGCDDPNEVISLFSSGVDFTFDVPPIDPEVAHESGSDMG